MYSNHVHARCSFSFIITASLFYIFIFHVKKQESIVNNSTATEDNLIVDDREGR